MISTGLGRLAAWCGRHAAIVLVAAAIGAGGSLVAVYQRLGVTTDTGTLFSATLPWKQRQAELRAAFPQGEDLLVAVVDAAIPEEADATAAGLAEALGRDTQHFTVVRRPDASPYLARNAFLFLDVKPLGELLDKTIDAQPFLGQLAADPSLRGLVEALSLIGEGAQRGQADLVPFTAALRGVHQALAGADPDKPLSWMNLLAGPVASLTGKYRFVLAKPVLDFGALQPGATATQAIREAAGRLEFVRSGAAHVRITGSVALDDDEFATVAQGAVAGLVGSLVLVSVLLLAATRSWRLVGSIVVTLLFGLALTAGFAAVAVGTLNLVSVAFAVLFVGLAVDFAIQFSVCFRDVSLREPALVAALAETGRRCGGQILVASTATAAGFLAFTPTSFAGVAQLGLIAGAGMLLAFASTLTLLPAVIAALRPRGGAEEVGFRWARPVDAAIVRHRRAILAGVSLLAAIGAGLLPWLRFDGDPLHTKNQSTESVRTLNDLAADPTTNPYTIDVLMPSAAVAAALVPRLKALPMVEDVLSLDSLVPEGQTAKLPLIADAASVLMASVSAPAAAAPDAVALRAAVVKALPGLKAALGRLPADSPFAAIVEDLERLATGPAARLMGADRALTRFLPGQLEQLRTALQARPVTRADVPAELARDWMMPDGRARLQVLPTRRAAADSAALQGFVAAVSAVAPGAGGSAVTIVRSAQTIVSSFVIAAAGALAAITVILLVTFRQLYDTALVLAPLLVSSLLTVIMAVLLPLPLNFANIITLPLLLGVGVSFNVYFVMNWRAGKTEPLSSATARAILFSALTTATAFGSLALSGHPGTASMGALLLVSLGCTLVTTLVFVPALLAVRQG